MARPSALFLALASAILLLRPGQVRCQQYVPESFLNNPPTDGMAIKSWTFLKESMERMGDQAADILTIREDVGSMQADLDAQVNLWHQAKAELLQENAGLKTEVDRLNREIADGAQVQVTVLAAQQKITDGKAKLEEAKTNATKLQASVSSERITFQKRISELAIRLQEVRKAALDEKNTEQGDEIQLHNDGLVLKAKATELGSQVGDVKAEVSKERQVADQKSSELLELHQELSANVKKLKGGVQPEEPLQKAMVVLQAQLQKDTTQVVTAKADYSQVSIACKKKTEEMAKVLADEQAALVRAEEETKGFCGPVQGKNAIYKQLLQKCQGPTAPIADPVPSIMRP